MMSDKLPNKLLRCSELTKEERIQIALGTKQLREVLVQIAQKRRDLDQAEKIWDDWYTVQVATDTDEEACVVADYRFFEKPKEGGFLPLLSVSHFLNKIKSNLEVRYTVVEVLGNGNYTKSCTMYRKDLVAWNRFSSR